jgi:hypothetical protein
MIRRQTIGPKLTIGQKIRQAFKVRAHKTALKFETDILKIEQGIDVKKLSLTRLNELVKERRQARFKTVAALRQLKELSKISEGQRKRVEGRVQQFKEQLMEQQGEEKAIRSEIQTRLQTK